MMWVVASRRLIRQNLLQKEEVNWKRLIRDSHCLITVKLQGIV